MTVSLGLQGRAAATVLDPASGLRHVVQAENRVLLLYVLARKLIEDQRGGKAPRDAGWCGDSEVMTGIWGRAWEKMGLNNYQVLIWRTRKELAKAGLDPWFLEKRRGLTRLRLLDVRLDTSTEKPPVTAS